MNKKSLRIRIYERHDDDGNNLLLSKSPVTIDAIPGALQLMPEGGCVVIDIVEYSADSVA